MVRGSALLESGMFNALGPLGAVFLCLSAASLGACNGGSTETEGETSGVCEDLFSGGRPAPEEVPVVLRNTTGAGIWVRYSYPRSGDNLHQVIQIVPAGGAVSLVTAPTACDFPCTSYKSTCEVSCTDNGPELWPLYIAPGGVYETSWSGQHFPRMPLPSECASCQGSPLCGRWAAAAAGEYEARIDYSPAGACAECTCTPNEQGWCFPDGPASESLGEMVTLSAPLTFPGGAVELVIAE